MADVEMVRRLAGATGNLAVVAVARPDGSVHASVVSAGVIGDPVTGELSVGLVAVGGARKLDYMRIGGRATLVFRHGWEWVAVEGPVRIVGPDDSAEGIPTGGVPQLLRDIFTAAGGAHDDWSEYDRVMAEEQRTAVFVRMERITSNG